MIAMLEFKAYFDASGDSHSAVMTVAGFVSRLEKWTRLEQEWRRLLPEGITKFHMTDFVSFRDGWESWRGRPERADLFDALISCIKRNTNKGFGASIRMSDYHSFNERYPLKEVSGGAYAMLGCACLYELREWAERRGLDYRKIMCVFEDGDIDQYALISRARSEGYNAFSQSKADTRAFDPCDLAAWKVRTLADDKLVKELHIHDPVGAERMRKALAVLDPILQFNSVIGQSTLESLPENLEGFEPRPEREKDGPK